MEHPSRKKPPLQAGGTARRRVLFAARQGPPCVVLQGYLAHEKKTPTPSDNLCGHVVAHGHVIRVISQRVCHADVRAKWVLKKNTTRCRRGPPRSCRAPPGASASLPAGPARCIGVSPSGPRDCSRVPVASDVGRGSGVVRFRCRVWRVTGCFKCEALHEHRGLQVSGEHRAL